MLDDDRPTYGPHPDAVLLRQRRTQRAIATVKLALAMQESLKPGRGKRSGNPKPRSLAKPKTCVRCLTVYPQSKGNFNHTRERVCFRCYEKQRAKLAARKAALQQWRDDFNRRRAKA